MNKITITVSPEMRAFAQGVQDGKTIADKVADREQWAFFAGRSFALRHGEDQSTDEAQMYVVGLQTHKPSYLKGDECQVRYPLGLPAELPCAVCGEGVAYHETTP